jgi:hypothetical protein
MVHEEDIYAINLTWVVQQKLIHKIYKMATTNWVQKW